LESGRGLAFWQQSAWRSEPGSDGDLFVVLPDDASDATFDPLVAWRLRKDAHVRVDIVLCRAADFHEDRRGTHDTLAYEAATGGVRIS
jgi:hypothetical protein